MESNGGHGEHLEGFASEDDLRAYIEDMARQLAELAVAQGDLSLASTLHAAAAQAAGKRPVQ